MLALAALMVSCVAELDTTPEVDITTVRCTIPRIDVEEDFATGILDTLTATKATFSNSNFLWSAGDKIGIVPNTGAQIYFEVDNGAGTSTASFDGGDWAMKSTGTFYAYYPLYPDIFLSKDHVSVSYMGQTQDGNNNNLHTGDYWTLYTEGTTAVGNALNFSFNHLTSFFKTYVTVPAGTYTKITFSAPSEVFIKDGYFDLSAQTPTIVGTTMTDELSLDLQNVTFADETELTGYLVVAPFDITGVPITVTVYKDGEPAYEYTLTKANPMVAAKTYAFRATALTQLAASATQANALFAAGATSVSITEPLTEDMAIVLPNTSEAVTLILPTIASTSTLTVSYPQNAASYPATVTITGPEGANLNIQTPNSTVTINGIAYDQITSRTAANTCIISAGVTVNVLKVIQGGVQVYGTVSQIDLTEQEDDAIINVSGTVSSLLGEDNEEYAPATGITLNKSYINLNVGATETLTATVAPIGAYPNIVWSSSDEAVATISTTGVVNAVAEGHVTITAKTVYGGHSASCDIAVAASSTIGGMEYIDLGFRKSHVDSRITPGSKYDRKIVFATCNIGADSPEDFGYYFRWGELNGWKIVTGTPNQYGDAFILSATQHDKDGNTLSSVWSTSIFSDSYALSGGTSLEDFKGKTNLQYNSTVYGDAATYNWGKPWVTPDYPTLNALLGNPTGNITLSNSPKDIVIGNNNGNITLAYSYTERNGIIGLLIENQSISESIFIPAGGFCLDDQLWSSGSYNDMGELWSSSKGAFNGTAYFMQFINSNDLYLQTKGTFYGSPIRPVAELTLSDEYMPVEPPSVGNIQAQSVDYRKATLSSSLVNDGNAITEFGFFYGTSAESMNTKLIASGGARGYSTGDFSKVINGLNPGTTYYFKAYATNEAGSVESAVQSFTTNSLTYYENGHNCGNGIEIVQNVGNVQKTVIWAPVNLGYYDTSNNKYLYGRLYQWGRIAGQGYAMNMITTASGDLYTYTDEKGKTVHVKVNRELPLTTPDPNTWYCSTAFTEWSDDNEQYYEEIVSYWNGSWEHRFDGDWNTLEKDDYIGNPCPDGWRIPSSAELSGLIANKSSFITVNNQKGYYFYGLNSNGNRVFFPASGKGGPKPSAARGTIGRYWTNWTDVKEFDGGEYWIYYNVGHYLQLDSSGASLEHDSDEYYDGKEDNYAYQTEALSIRCVKEE